MRITAVAFLVVFSALAACGCRPRDKKPPAQNVPAGKARPSQPTLAEKVQHEISRKVLSDVQVTGRLKAVKSRGILRVALPPAQKPFQYPAPGLNVPAGFNAALAGEIARALEVRPNVTILSRAAVERLNESGGAGTPYDIIVRTPGMVSCPPGRSLPYYFLGQGKGWLSLCVSGKEPELMQAVENALSYFAETGIFARLYSDYFQ